MKRREFIRHLEAHGRPIKREGGSDSVQIVLEAVGGQGKDRPALIRHHIGPAQELVVAIGDDRARLLAEQSASAAGASGR